MEIVGAMWLGLAAAAYCVSRQGRAARESMARARVMETNYQRRRWESLRFLLAPCDAMVIVIVTNNDKPKDKPKEGIDHEFSNKSGSATA